MGSLLLIYGGGGVVLYGALRTTFQFMPELKRPAPEYAVESSKEIAGV